MKEDKYIEAILIFMLIVSSEHTHIDHPDPVATAWTIEKKNKNDNLEYLSLLSLCLTLQLYLLPTAIITHIHHNNINQII